MFSLVSLLSSIYLLHYDTSSPCNVDDVMRWKKDMETGLDS